MREPRTHANEQPAEWDRVFELEDEMAALPGCMDESGPEKVRDEFRWRCYEAEKEMLRRHAICRDLHEKACLLLVSAGYAYHLVRVTLGRLEVFGDIATVGYIAGTDWQRRKWWKFFRRGPHGELLERLDEFLQRWKAWRAKHDG